MTEQSDDVERLELEVARVRERHAVLAERLNIVTARNAQLTQQLRHLRERVGTRPTSDHLFERFVADSNVVVRPELVQALVNRMRKANPESATDEYVDELRRTRYRAVLRDLFGEELLMSRQISPRDLKQVSSFCRGRVDLENASSRGIDAEQMAKSKVEITEHAMHVVLLDDDFDVPPRRILEIGGAWGATIRHLQQRFAPHEYRNYEIDRAYARWAQQELGVRALPTDGETLVGTDDATIDLTIANNVLFFTPAIKVWSYLREMARVTSTNGLVVFNALIADRCTDAKLESYMRDSFPRRAFSLVPEEFVRRAFPAAEFDVVRCLSEAPGSRQIPYFVMRRTAPRASVTA